MLKKYKDFINESFKVNSNSIRGVDDKSFMWVTTEIAKTLLKVRNRSDVRLIVGAKEPRIIEAIEEYLVPDSENIYDDIPSELYDIQSLNTDGDLDDLIDNLDNETYYLYEYKGLQFVMTRVDEPADFPEFESVFYFKHKDSNKWNTIINNLLNLN
jgi:hypothetical protein